MPASTCPHSSNTEVIGSLPRVWEDKTENFGHRLLSETRVKKRLVFVGRAKRSPSDKELERKRERKYELAVRTSK